MSLAAKLLLAVLVAAGAGGALVYYRYKDEISQARAKATQARIARTFAGPIEYAERGAGFPQNITAPTLVISAKDDLFNTRPAAEFAARTIPNAKLIVYETGGHLLVGRQQEVSDAVGDFLKRHAHSSEPND